jgi:hypothetical protein
MPVTRWSNTAIMSVPRAAAFFKQSASFTHNSATMSVLSSAITRCRASIRMPNRRPKRRRPRRHKAKIYINIPNSLNSIPNGFATNFKDHKYEDRVREDFRRGVANGVYGTPGLFVNGIRHNGGLDVASIVAKLKEVSP